MLSRWRHSLIRATLLRIAIGALLLAVLGTYVAYYLLFRAIEEQAVINLHKHVAERARHEETQFAQIADNLNLAVRAFLERYAQPDPPGYIERWDELFVRDPHDGAWRSRRDRFDGTRDTTLWVHRDTVLTDEVKRRLLILFDVHERLRPAWIGSFRSLWASIPEMSVLGFDPLIPNWAYETPGDWDQNASEWATIADPQHNPGRRMVWSKSIVEGNGGECYVSVCLPVYVGDRYVATFGHDIRVFRLIHRTLQSDIPELMQMLVRDDGRIIAHPDKGDEIVGSNGDYTMRDDPQLAAIFAHLQEHREEQFAGYDPVSKRYFAAHRLSGPRWLWVATLPRAVIAREAFSHAQWILWSGGASVIVLLVLLAVTLRRGIAVPLMNLTRATERLSEGESPGALVVVRDDELGQLATAFNRMSEKIGERDAAMRQLNADLERRIAVRTAELQASESRVRAMLENTPGAIVVIDANTNRFVAANEIALRSLGVPRERLEQYGPLDVSPAVQENGRPSTIVLREVMQAAQDGRTVSFEWQHHGTDGVIVPCEVRLSRLPDARGRNLVIATIIDITARKQAEKRLLQTLEHERELNELKTNFVSMVSHEFRTPLGIISSSAEILSRYFDRLDPAARREHLTTIVRSTRVLSRMMEEVLLLGRFESGRLAFTPKPVDLLALARTLADEVLSATDDACPIHVVAEGDISGAQSDEFLLRHIFTNLLSNAVKYSPAGSPIDFTIACEGAEAVFRVRDRGIGIHAEDLRVLFQAFRRGRNVGARAGSGLGLVIVQRCVHLHGGDIQIESEPGQGTCATVRLKVFTTPASASTGATTRSRDAAPLPRE